MKKQTQRLVFFSKLIDCNSSLKITKIIWKWSKRRHYYPIEINASIKELLGAFEKSIKPYETKDMFDFLDGKTDKITIDNGYEKFFVSI